MTLSEFASAWNELHKNVLFSIYEMPGTGIPLNVEIRYPVLEGLSPSHEEWYSLNNTSKLTSHGTMFISSTETMFEHGIIEMKIASQGKKFHNDFVVTTLAWIGEKFLPKNIK